MAWMRAVLLPVLALMCTAGVPETEVAEATPTALRGQVQEQIVTAQLPDAPDFERRDDSVWSSSAGAEGWDVEGDDDEDIEPLVNLVSEIALERSAAKRPSDDDDDLFDDPGVPKIFSGCHDFNGTAGIPCPTGLTCVLHHDKTFSQCVPCQPRRFGQVCQKLDDFMRYAAVHTCNRTCPDTKCYNKNWCIFPYRCIIDVEESWGQCIHCRSKKFWGNSCHSMQEGLMERAEKVCHRKCREY